jgi:hypothetical protein
MSSPTNPEQMPMKNVVPTGKRIKATCPNCNVQLDGNDRCRKCGYVRVKGYDTDDPERDMTGHGFAKSLTFKDIQVNEETGKITVFERDFYVREFECSSCQTDRFTWLMAGRTGVYKSCLRCGKTTGPVSMEDSILRKTYEITPQQALAILNERSAPQWMKTPIQKMIHGKRYVEPRARPKTVK